MKLFFHGKLTNTLLLIAFLILMATGIFAYYQIYHLLKSNTWVIHTHNVMETANESLLAVTIAEVKVERYLLAGDKNISQPVPELLQLTKDSIKKLKELTKDNPIQQKRLKVLEPLVKQKINALQKAISYVFPQHKTEATKLIASMEQQKIAQQIRKILLSFNSEELHLLKIRSDNFNKYVEESIKILILFGSLSVILFLISFIFLSYFSMLRNKDQKKLQELNKQLKTSEERFTLATEGARVGLWDWEPGSDYVFYSPFLKKMLGYTEEEFPNTLQSFQNILHPDDNDRLWDLVNQHLQ
ncbi:MAG: hypothetical protein EPO11_01060, partial [Gammaproteobacteria bacterium]